jgi:hypothetical protein
MLRDTLLWLSALAPDHTTGKPRPFFGADLISYTETSERRPVDTVAKGEQVEGELDSFIAKRDKQRRREEGDRPAHEIYADSVRLYHDKRELQRAWEWLRYHEAQIRRLSDTLEAIISRHRKEAARYAELLGVEPAKLDETAKRNGHKKRGEAA